MVSMKLDSVSRTEQYLLCSRKLKKGVRCHFKEKCLPLNRLIKVIMSGLRGHVRPSPVPSHGK